MPFEPYAVSDAKTSENITARLAAIGLVAVPDEIVRNYMREVLLKDRTHGVWNTAILPSENVIGSLRSPQILRKHDLGFWAGAPRRVRKLAARVQQNMPEAVFVLGYFRSDPYLQLKIGYQSAYLAVWRNRFRLVAIASKQE